VHGIKDVVPGVTVIAPKKRDGFLNLLVQQLVAVGSQGFKRSKWLIRNVHFGEGFGLGSTSDFWFKQKSS